MASPQNNTYNVPSGDSIVAGYFVEGPARYIYNAPTILYDAPMGTTIISGLCYTPARPSVDAPTDDYLWNDTGPTKTAVEQASQWSWANSGGDWLDINGISQGTTACWTFLANAVTSGSYTYAIDVTTALNFSRTQNLWNAWIMKCSGNRTWSTRHGTNPPSIFVTYTDATTETLSCTASVAFVSNSAYSRVGDPSGNFNGNNAAIEFTKPSKTVASAMLSFTILTHSAVTATVNGFLLNPPINSAPVTYGLAQSYVLDAGIAANPNVISSFRFQDGSVLSDFIANGGSTSNLKYSSEWSPHVFYGGTPDNSKLPFAFQGVPLNGRMIASTGSGGSGGGIPTPPAIINSSYVGNGFTPIAPGIGALKTTIAGNNAADGAVVGSAGSLGADLFTFLGDGDIGYLDDMYVRYNLMLGTYPEQTIANTSMYRNYPIANNGHAIYIQPRGKIGPAPAHLTTYGGNNRWGGGNLGWSSRFGYINWADMDPNTTSFFFHALDMLPSNTPGTKSGNVFAGQQGGIGTRLLRGIWYDIECRLKLNTWTTDGSDTTDAVYQMWIDGKLAVDFTGFSFRKGPINYTDPNINSGRMGYTPIVSNKFPPIRELGMLGIWLNDYQGGITSCEFDQVNFYACICVSKTRIGPLRLS